MMTLKSWLAVAGFAGLYSLIQYSEWAFLTGRYRDGDAQNWVDRGATLSTTSQSIKAMCYVVNEFNDFMDSVFLHPEFGILSDFTQITEVGYTIPDLVITLPNGLVLKIIDSSEVVDFRLSNMAGEWKGFITPVGWFTDTYGWLAMRLKSDPTIDFFLPGSTELNYVEVSSGIIKKGSECDPVQGISLTNTEYAASCLTLFIWICDCLRSLGLIKSLKSWYSKFILRRDLGKIRDISADIQENIEIVDSSIANIKSTVDELQTVMHSKIGVDSNVLDDLFSKLKKLGYRPYG